MTRSRSPISSSTFARLGAAACAAAFLSACGDSDGTPDSNKAGLEVGRPPAQKAISLRAKHARPPGTTFRNRATLTMADADLLMRREEANISGKATTIIRDLWDVVQVSPTERRFTIEEMSLSNQTTIEGDRKDESSESTLTGIPLTVTRSDPSADWELAPPENKLTNFQEGDLRMLGNLWSEGTADLYPAEPLDLGETWHPDPKSVGLIVSPRLKVEGGEVTCTLDEITVLQGERCAAVSIDIDITGSFETGGGSSIQVQVALTGIILRSLYKNFDMRTELKGTMQWEVELPGQDTTISIDGVTEIVQKAEMVEPQPE